MFSPFSVIINSKTHFIIIGFCTEILLIQTRRIIMHANDQRHQNSSKIITRYNYFNPVPASSHMLASWSSTPSSVLYDFLWVCGVWSTTTVGLIEGQSSGLWSSMTFRICLATFLLWPIPSHFVHKLKSFHLVMKPKDLNWSVGVRQRPSKWACE